MNSVEYLYRIARAASLCLTGTCVVLMIGCNRSAPNESEAPAPQASRDHATPDPATIHTAEEKAHSDRQPAPADAGEAHIQVEALLSKGDWRGAFRAALGYVGSLSLEDASAFLETLPFGKIHTSCLGILAKRYATEAPELALDWLATLPKSGSFGRAYAVVGKQLPLSNRSEAIKFLRGIEDALLRDKFGGFLLMHLAAEEPNSALKFLSENESLFLSPDGAFGSYISGLDEGRHYKLAAQALVLSEQRNNIGLLTTQLGRRWASEPDAGALEFFSRNSQDAAAAKIAGAYVGQWSKYDAAAASEWMRAVDESPLRDAVIEDFAKTTFRHQPEMALRWLAAHSDAAIRQKLAQELLLQIVVDPEKVKSLAAELGLLP